MLFTSSQASFYLGLYLLFLAYLILPAILNIIRYFYFMLDFMVERCTVIDWGRNTYSTVCQSFLSTKSSQVFCEKYFSLMRKYHTMFHGNKIKHLAKSVFNYGLDRPKSLIKCSFL